MGKGVRSPIWQYFDKSVAEPSFAICKKCKSKVSRGSKEPKKMTNSNLVSHLLRNHEDLHKLYKQIDGQNNENKRKAEEEEEVRGITLKNKKQKNDYFQLTLPESVLKATLWVKDSPMTKESHKRVLLMMIQDLRPYSDIMKGGLLQLLKFLQPKFEPASDKFYREMMQASYSRCKEKVKDIINKANPAQVSLVLDGWSSYHHGYVGVNIHYINENWKRVKINICCKKFDESHTGQALATFIADLTHEWNIFDKILVAVTDSASNMKKMFEYLPWERADCGNHTLQLSINDEIFSMNSVDALSKKCRAVCTFQNKTQQFAQALIAAQAADASRGGAQELYLVQDVSTRWNSTYDMLERFYKVKAAVKTLLNDPKWGEKLNIHLYQSDWELMAKVVTVLKVFKEATQMLSSSQASISQVIPLITVIKAALKRGRDDQGVKTLKVKLNNSLERRFGHKEFDTKYSVATLLDPRYKKSFFQSKQAKDVAVSSLLEELKKEARKSAGVEDLLLPEAAPVQGPEDENFTVQSLMKEVIADNSDGDSAHNESGDIEEKVLFGFLSAPVEESRCLEYWKEFEDIAGTDPVKLSLVRLAKKYLTPPPTSTDVERLFSVAGNILTEERNSLLPENVDKLLFLKENIRNLNFEL